MTCVTIVLPTCYDGIMNGNELGIDCGLTAGCLGCINEACTIGSGCYSGACRNNLCGAACGAGYYTNTSNSACIACLPGSYSSNLTTVHTCTSCPIGYYMPSSGAANCTICLTSNTTGQSTCTPTCADGIMDYDEVGVDCGYWAGCGLCGTGASCGANYDCTLGMCAASVCLNCTLNGIRDSDESGRYSPARCAACVCHVHSVLICLIV